MINAICSLCVYVFWVNDTIKRTGLLTLYDQDEILDATSYISQQKDVIVPPGKSIWCFSQAMTITPPKIGESRLYYAEYSFNGPQTFKTQYIII